MVNNSNSRNGPVKKFCLLTTGRAGSTSLMKVLENYDDVAVPNKLFHCPNNELVHLRMKRRHKTLMSKLVGKQIKTDSELINSFYEYNREFTYVGFKSMPNRHRDTPNFFDREDITFIILTRKDIPSTVASFYAANKKKTWARTGGKQTSKLCIRGFDKIRTKGVIRYVLGSLRLLRRITPAIRISYEDLCQPDFNNPQLNDFFNRKIQLEKPTQQISGDQYIENWEWLKEAVAEKTNRH